jgi:hypothetical protein
MRSVQPPVPPPSYPRPTPPDLPTPAYPWRGSPGSTVQPSRDGLGGFLDGIFLLPSVGAAQAPAPLDATGPVS